MKTCYQQIWDHKLLSMLQVTHGLKTDFKLTIWYWWKDRVCPATYLLWWHGIIFGPWIGHTVTRCLRRSWITVLRHWHQFSTDNLGDKPWHWTHPPKVTALQISISTRKAHLLERIDICTKMIWRSIVYTKELKQLIKEDPGENYLTILLGSKFSNCRILCVPKCTWKVM